MKELALILCLTASINGFSQNIQSFRSLRYNEDYSYLKNDSSSSWYRNLKYTPLSKNGNTYLSTGGEIRYQYFYLKNEDWGDAPEDTDGYVLSRFLAHADLHVGRKFRTFVQLQSSLANGKTSTSPVEENPLELHQAFADLNLSTGKDQMLLFRFGRQEFSYGSQRLISVREIRNNRQSFDAIKSVFRSGYYQLDLFYSHYVTAEKGIFNDGSDRNIQFWGAYLVRNKIPVFQNIDLYYLGLNRKQAEFDDGEGTELRHSVGSRIWSDQQNLQFDIEGLYQWGKFGDGKISAWSLSSNVSYSFPYRLKPMLGLKTEFISGDHTYDDRQLNTFNPLFPRGAYFGLAALIGPSNLFDLHPYFEFELNKKLILQTDYDIFWRISTNDGIYGSNVRLIYSGKGTSSKQIGSQLGTALLYTPNAWLYFRGEFTWFNADEYLKEAGTGKDILMAGATVQLKF